MSNKKASKTLKNAKRDQIGVAVKKRGRQVSNIWLIYSPRLADDVVIITDAWMEHFYICESDPLVIDVEYHPEPKKLPGKGRPVEFGALVSKADGTLECRGLATDPTETERRTIAAAELGGIYVPLDEGWFIDRTQVVANAKREIAALSRCRGRDLGTFKSVVVARLSNKPCSIGELRSAFDPLKGATLLAAITSLVHEGKATSDLDQRTWSDLTLIRLVVEP